MSRLDQVTPVILTRDEAPNVGRLLEDLAWARSIVVVDSGSTDDTANIAARFGNVRWIERPFDSHGAQWRFAVGLAETEYVLALDADYRVPAAFVTELESRFLSGSYAAGVAAFRYCIQGRPLRGSVYPAKVVVFRRADARITQPGHSQDIGVDGESYRFTERLAHDDRKPLARFVESQRIYAGLEADRLMRPGTRRWQDRVRQTALTPFIVGPAAYLAAGGPLAGRAALQYACERTVFECLLALELLRRRLHRS
jgi:glycosyltransferase involved in cell wall biosynthesis